MIHSNNLYGHEFHPGFIKEMTGLLINNLTNLYNGLNEAVIKNEPKIYNQRLNQSHFVLILINNQNLITITNTIKEIMALPSSDGIDFKILNSFRKSCMQEINMLTEKLAIFERLDPNLSSDH